VIICPCCGFKFEGDLMAGCDACGARAVGPPLAKPQHELPSYGRAFLIGATGFIMLAVMLGFTLSALMQNGPISTSFWSLVAAAETAAWGLKWFALPISIVALWSGVRVSRSIKAAPLRFTGARLAHTGLLTAASVTLAIATLIAVTIPERWHQHRDSVEAGIQAKAYTIHRAQMEYQQRYGTFPGDLSELKNRLNDLDGSLAEALSTANPLGYQPTTEVAVKAQPGNVRRTVFRNVSQVTDESLGQAVTFTNYKIRLAGEDKIPGNDDDWIMRDGLIMKVSEDRESAASTSVKPGKP
jgi:hypothetical protein